MRFKACNPHGFVLKPVVNALMECIELSKRREVADWLIVLALLVAMYSNPGNQLNGSWNSFQLKKRAQQISDVPSKRAFGFLEKKLEFAASNVACNTMKEAALEIRSNKTDAEISQCGVSVDGT
ncbi:hypothetical protein TNCV_1556271 [Trichonephila clavipes]|nr:hypothetical protein TNCV_1556271 [Trichonephila clavipes]